MPLWQEQFLDLQEDLIAIAEAMEKVATERKKILVRGTIDKVVIRGGDGPRLGISK